MTWQPKLSTTASLVLTIATPAVAQSTNGGLPKSEGPDVLVIGFALGTLLLLVALIYGVMRYSQRDRSKETLTEEATREVYRQPDA